MNDSEGCGCPNCPPPPTRRGFLAYIAQGMGALAGVFFAFPVVSYLLGNWKRNNDVWVNVGKLEDFPVNQTRRVVFSNPYRRPWDGASGESAAFIRYLGKDSDGKDDFLVLSVNCTHLGCGVSWFPESGLFLCPCHGGVYYENGDRASGPPPRGLYHYTWRLRDGSIEIEGPHLPTLQDPLIEKPGTASA